MSLEKDEVYTDLKYNCDLVVQDIMDSVVLIKELDSGNSHLYGREEFDKEKERFARKK